MSDNKREFDLIFVQKLDSDQKEKEKLIRKINMLLDEKEDATMKFEVERSELSKIMEAAGKTRTAITRLLNTIHTEEDRVRFRMAFDSSTEVVRRLDNIIFSGMWTEEEIKGA